MIALRITLAAQLCGLGMGVATIVGLVPAVTRLIRGLI
jgi:hypothetical protein